MHSDDQSPRQDLFNNEAVNKLKELAEKSRNCFFCTNLGSYPHTSRPMALQEVDQEGNLWFISSTESTKNSEIAHDPRVSLYFQNNSSYEFLVVSGKATIHTDKALIDKYWTNFANAWFEGKEDPTVSIISVKPDESDYWDTQDGKIVSFIKMSFMAITGKKSDDGGIEGSLKV
ncbi:MAG: pyridoxamine 5'-phosphate oxidase family protein [Saprospiraceae bacterium]|nr:pyridoxamine 5'-phosphate oxidase family protein [Saprospiraceae bacterium]